MSRWLALAKHAEENSAPPFDTSTKDDKTTNLGPKSRQAGELCPLLSTCRTNVGEKDRARTLRQIAVKAPFAPNSLQHLPAHLKEKTISHVQCHPVSS